MTQLTDPLLLAIDTHENQRHGVILVSMGLEENTTLLTALDTGLFHITTEGRIVYHILLDKLDQRSGN